MIWNLTRWLSQNRPREPLDRDEVKRSIRLNLNQEKTQSSEQRNMFSLLRNGIITVLNRNFHGSFAGTCMRQ